jgi:1-acyl-sn-glycerol-3-phosphate acyltransferase
MPKASTTARQHDPTSIRIEDSLSVVRSLYAELHRAPGGLQLITLESTLERDLGFDSLARAELLSRVEQHFRVHLPIQTLESVETVADLVNAVASASGPLPMPGKAYPAPPGVAPAITSARSPGLPNHAATLNEVLEWRARTAPDGIHAVVLGETDPEPLTYAQLHQGAQIIAAGLVDTGVQPGATVALMLPTSRAYLRAFFGTLLAGAIPVPIYPPTRPSQLEEHVHRHAGILSNAAADTLVTFQEARTVARLLRTRVPTLRNIRSIAELSQGKRVCAGRRLSSPDSIAMLQYTSGSTGAPKGVTLSHSNLLANIRAMGRVIMASDSDVFVSWLPLYHDMGLIGAWLGSLYFGCLFVVMPPTSFLARPARWLRTIHEYRATLSASPNFGYELCARRLQDEDLRGLDLSSWRVAFNGAEPVCADTLTRFNERLGPYGFRPEAMTPVYGLAETAVGLTFPPLGRGPLTDYVDRDEMMGTGQALPVAADHPGALCFVSCGKPLPGYQVRIVDAGGAQAPERIEGTVQFSGPSATVGYYRNTTATARLFHDGWLDSGDRGYLSGGELYITGRIKDIIIRRGRHIYPDEIEHAVGELEGVRKGCVAAFGTNEPATATEKLVVLAETHYRDPMLLGQLKSRINQKVVDTLGEPPEEILLAPPHTVLKTSSGKLRRAATRTAYEDGSLERAPARPAVQMLRLAIESAGPALRRIVQAGTRTAYGWYAWVAVVAFWSVVWAIGLMLPRPHQIWRLNHRAARWLISALRIPFLVSWETGTDLAAPHIIVTNHCSYVDSIFVAAALPYPHLFVAKAELQRAPVLGAWLRRIGTLFIERFEPVQSVGEVTRLQQFLAQGNSLVMFPEGTFTRVTGLRPFHLGAFQVAAASGVPIIPLTLRGTRSVLRDGQHMLRRMPVSALASSPIVAPAGVDRFTSAVRLRDAARGNILRHCGEPDLA